MPTADEYLERLAKLPKSPVDVRLTRIVPFLKYDASIRRSFLFTSGRPNRCNPKGVRCIYFSETEETAHAEWKEMNIDPNQPTLTFHGRLTATSILDLEDLSVCADLELTGEDLGGNFRLQDLKLQSLGKAVSLQQDVVAIRYPSRAMAVLGRVGYNLAIFPNAVLRPDSFVIYGEGDAVLEQWP